MYFIKYRELEGNDHALCSGHMKFAVDCFRFIVLIFCVFSSKLVWENRYSGQDWDFLSLSSPKCWDSIIKYATTSSHILTV